MRRLWAVWVVWVASGATAAAAYAAENVITYGVASWVGGAAAAVLWQHYVWSGRPR